MQELLFARLAPLLLLSALPPKTLTLEDTNVLAGRGPPASTNMLGSHDSANTTAYQDHKTFASEDLVSQDPAETLAYHDVKTRALQRGTPDIQACPDATGVGGVCQGGEGGCGVKSLEAGLAVVGRNADFVAGVVGVKKKESDGGGRVDRKSDYVGSDVDKGSGGSDDLEDDRSEGEEERDGEDMGGLMEEVSGLLWERCSRVYEYDQVTVFLSRESSYDNCHWIGW